MQHTMFLVFLKRGGFVKGDHLSLPNGQFLAPVNRCKHLTLGVPAACNNITTERKREGGREGGREREE